MAHDAIRLEFRELIDEHAPVRQLGSGFIFTEGPIWHPHEQYLLFSDMPGDVRRRWDNSGIREIETASNKGNGMTYDRELNLLVCEHSTSCLARLSPTGSREVLASHFEGRELNSPNDVCVRSDGSIYFTDPWYGRKPHFGIERPRDLGWQGVFRIPPGRSGGDPQLVVDRYMFSMPNGICFSPDERLIYINDTEQANIRVFDVAADGSLSNQRVFASGIKDALKPGLPDGMKCDALGNVWVTAPGGLWVYNPSGQLIGKVSLPELAANLHWGGPDWQTLFVCATTSLYAVETKVGPRNEPFMTTQSARPAHATNSESSSADAARSHSEVSGASSDLALEPDRCALIIMDMQNDVVMDGGAFADSGSPVHTREQNAIGNAQRLADHCRSLGIPVIHVWMLVPPGSKGLTLNCPLFEGLADANALVEGSWGAQPVPGLEAKPDDHIVRKSRMSAWEGTNFETVLKAEGRDIVIETGAWTNMSIEHTARTGADKGYVMIVADDGCSTMNAEWHAAAVNYALQQVAAVASTSDIIKALGPAPRASGHVNQGAGRSPGPASQSQATPNSLPGLP